MPVVPRIQDLVSPRIRDVEGPGVHKTWRITTTTRMEACLFTLAAYAMGVVAMADLFDQSVAYLGFVPAFVVLLYAAPRRRLVTTLPDGDTLSTTTFDTVMHAAMMALVGANVTYFTLQGPGWAGCAALILGVAVAFHTRPTRQSRKPKHLLESATFPDTP